MAAERGGAAQVQGSGEAAEHKGFDIFIRNLPEDTKAGELAAFFKKAGKIIRPPRLNLSRGFAWITFESVAAVQRATTWSGSYYGPRMIYVHAANNSAEDAGQPPRESFAGLHLPALCEETVAKLVAPDPSGTFVDGTFGRGGHSRAMLAAMGSEGRLHAFDMDPEAVKVGRDLAAEDARFTMHHARFSDMRSVLAGAGVRPGSVAGVLLDVGISSPQFNDTSRGAEPRLPAHRSERAALRARARALSAPQPITLILVLLFILSLTLAAAAACLRATRVAQGSDLRPTGPWTCASTRRRACRATSSSSACPATSSCASSTSSARRREALAARRRAASQTPFASRALGGSCRGRPRRSPSWWRRCAGGRARGSRCTRPR